METDAAIRAALKNENKHKTVIIISHHIATVKDADIIIVLEDGKITQQGTHRELPERGGLYKRIYVIFKTVKTIEQYPAYDIKNRQLHIVLSN